MERLSTERYHQLFAEAIIYFWGTRNSQAMKQINPDQGTRGSVTGGKQLDAVIDIFERIAMDLGVQACIYKKEIIFPGFLDLRRIGTF